MEEARALGLSIVELDDGVVSVLENSISGCIGKVSREDIDWSAVLDGGCLSSWLPESLCGQVEWKKVTAHHMFLSTSGLLVKYALIH